MARFARLSLLLVLASSLFVPSAFGAGEGSTTAEQKAEKIILSKINSFRVANGLTELTLHTFIQKEARKHSNYMGNHGALSHDNMDARFQRIVDNDSDIDIDKICEITAKAEGYDAPKPVARRISSAWKKNNTSKKCVLDTNFNTDSVGVGVQQFGADWYATLIAANDSSPG